MQDSDSDDLSSFSEGMMNEGIIESFTRCRKVEYKESKLNRSLKNVRIVYKQRNTPDYWDY
jgi:hypothetical protein